MTRDATTYKKTKIIATIGPSSEDHIESLLESGVNGIRLNFSHGDYRTHKRNLSIARRASRKLDRGLAVIQDLAGPKIRLGELPEKGVTIKRGDMVGFSFGDTYDEELGILPSQYNFADEVSIGEHVYLRDGQIALVVKHVKGGIVTAKALNSGVVLSHHGINLPDTVFKGSVVTDKDRQDILFAIQEDVDYVAVSFVQSVKTIKEVRRLLKPANHPVHIITKIETKAAVTNLDAIIEASDAIMIARGDLAVEIGAENVPIVGRRIIEAARRNNKPVIMATQMLESMIKSTQPSRAEANDVSTAVLLGVDAVMLSGETAIGDYPVETVKMMKRIILKAEQYSIMGTINLDFVSSEYGKAALIAPSLRKPDLQRIHDTTRLVFEQHNSPDETPQNHNIPASISLAAITLAEQIGAKLIVAETMTGDTAYSVSNLRPAVPIIMASPDRNVCNKLSIVWGGKPLLISNSSDTNQRIITRLKQTGAVKPNDYVICAYGRHRNVSGGTDTVRIMRVE